MKRTILVIALLCGWVNAHGAASWVQYDTSTKLVILPTNLFLANTSALTAALTAAGWSPGGGGGSGNASTNATQAWAAGYTNTAGGRWVFNGDLLAGSTNLVQKLGSIELALTGYQPLDADLTALASLNGAGLTNLNASTAFSSGQVPIARLATGTPDGTKFLRDDGVLAVPAGGGGVSLAGTNAWTGSNSFANTVTINGAANLNGTTTISNLTVPGTLSVGSITADSPIGTSIGGTGGTNPVTARSSLGLVYDVDVQAYRAGLLQLALAMTADGHMPLHNGSIVTNLATTAAGRALLTAASASAQWTANLLAVATTNGTYDASAWNGITDRTVTLDQFRDVIAALPGGSNAITSVTAPLTLTNGVLSIDTTGLGGGGGSGFTYLLTNAGGSFQDRASGTNWTIFSTTISSNNAPTATGKFVEGGFSAIVTNNSGTAGTWYYDVTVGGTLVFRDSFTHNSASTRALNAQFALVRESSTRATFAQVGVNVNVGSTTLGFGDAGATANGFSVIATNITVDWSAGVPVVLAVSSDTVVTTNTAYGLRVANSWLRTDAVASTGSGTGNVTGPASSTNNAIVLFSGTGGTNIADSGVLLSSLQTYDTDLDDLADGSLSGSKVGSGIDAGNITVGTLSSNRLPSAVAFTSMSVGTINATSVTGDAAGLTGINGTNITAGTVAAARLPTSGVSAGNYTNPTVTIDTYGRVTSAVNGTASSGGGGLTLVDAAPITNVNFRSSWANKASVSSVTNVDWVPQPPTTASSASLTPAFNSSRGHEFTLTNNATLNAPSGVTSAMVGDTFRLVFIQDSTGSRTLTTATNYLFGSDITGLTLTTNAGARDYMVLYVRRTDVFDVVGFVRGYAQ